MSTNDFILLQQLLQQRNAELAPTLSADEFFQVFACEQALKERDLTYDEIDDAVVDGSGDGGIDAVFVFLDNTLYKGDIDPSEVKRNTLLELVFVQAKKSEVDPARWTVFGLT